MPTSRQRAIAHFGQPSAFGTAYHVIYTLIVCSAGMSLPFLLGHDVSALAWLAILPTFLLANFVEYAIHRWLMHRNVKPLVYMLTAHMIHHNYFDERQYYLERVADYQMVVFPPLILNLLVIAVVLPLAAVTWLVAGENVALVFVATVMAYYLLMQVLHVLAHTDEKSAIHRIGWIDYIRNHHRIHHIHSEMAQWNFNFIVPLSDWTLGTSKVRLTKGSPKVAA
jgi:hypothetical protein